MKKRLVSLVTACGLALSLAACGGAGSESAASSEAASSEATASSEAASSEEASAGAAHYTIGICQLVQHDALDAATQGFQDALNEALGEENITWDLQNAQNDTATCATITNAFVASGVDLIMANGTAALQSAQAATSEIPILGTSITEYGVALGIDGFDGTVGTNISGTSDLAPLDEQAAMIQELFPDASTVGLLYCSAEPNSQYQVDTVQGYLEELGYTCTQYAFSDSNDLSSVCQGAADASDVIYIPTDNTAAGNAETIANVVLAAGVPVVTGESGLCSGCGVATLSISYYDLGYTTGEMAAQILQGEADITTMAVQSAPNVTKMYNAANCETLGITIPEGYEAIA